MARELKGERLEKELARLAAMHEYENAHADVRFIAGIDEAGRGPLAGPVVNDAVTIPGVEIPQESIIKGDAKSVSIAAASILAKVTRDHLMEEYDTLYPEYGFARNKGYGTKEHIEALKRLGPCPIHRHSFIGHFV